ncbi:hypothetical protein WR25_03340 isoform H [Diploscapter pachys]|uniref:Cytochrome P450 n=1 Tax=Diploscapter pachys TaxID=2018661 RepID=A0A2A2L3L8_9BILA|nr:hypothetical protein WR25_03340 isoform A [Diploscapter pachys]PAV80758.1 hypothetical protein WR25_03340 isoform B [Diploscapter pachys]PAV80759.1 hypothetical protein WR25_03340 isoform C [Diploscapter pachys]PAV80760.1 hypothetical protein WR25_03340 isoform D [Diploscapter pachys]PAV80761.1 hypothetical protein WR25_03340 isoform E [Diploscapter pachys]
MSRRTFQNLNPQRPSYKYIRERIPFLIRQTIITAKNGESIFRLWLGGKLWVIPINGKAVKDILDSNEELEKGDAYDFLGDWIGDGLLISVGNKWKGRRKLITPSFHFGMLAGYMETFNYHARIMMEILEGEVEKEFNMYNNVKRAALDIICDAAMGVHASAQTNPNHPYVIAVGKFNLLTVDYIFKPWLQIPILYSLFGFAKEKQDQLDILISFSKKVIKERKMEIAQGNIQERNGKKTFLDMLLTLEGLTDRDIQDEVDTFMFEGHDTTSSGTCWILWCLACHPHLQEKVHEEIYSIFGDSDRDMENEDLPKLPYFDRFIRECIRFRPPVPIIQRLLNNDFKMGGKTIPKGAFILISPMLQHHNPEIFPDPEKFDPDRFLSENISSRHPYDYIPFSAGPRNCVGRSKKSKIAPKMWE